MDRENKRKIFEKGYYKTHACRDAFTCKVCGRLCTPENAGSDHRNHCPSNAPANVETSPKATNTEEWISPRGGIQRPMKSNVIPARHKSVAMTSCNLMPIYFSRFP